MQTENLTGSLTTLFSELVDGARAPVGGIRAGLRDESHRWLQVLGSPRDVSTVELSGMIGEIVHVAYHLGAMRQIAASARGPRDGTFA